MSKKLADCGQTVNIFGFTLPSVTPCSTNNIYHNAGIHAEHIRVWGREDNLSLHHMPYCCYHVKYPQNLPDGYWI